MVSGLNISFNCLSLSCLFRLKQTHSYKVLSYMTSEETRYMSPEMEIYEVIAEGVLCVSDEDSGLDMNPEEGNM